MRYLAIYIPFENLADNRPGCKDITEVHHWIDRVPTHKPTDEVMTIFINSVLATTGRINMTTEGHIDDRSSIPFHIYGDREIYQIWRDREEYPGQRPELIWENKARSRNGKLGYYHNYQNV